MCDLGSRVICLRWDFRLSITLIASVASSVGVCVPESSRDSADLRDLSGQD